MSCSPCCAKEPAIFTDKVVIVTGSSSGIGAATAVEFAKLNAQVVITGRNKDNLLKVAKHCEEASPINLIPLILLGDLVNENDIHNIIVSTINKFNKIDVLVNNAGILESGTIETTSLEQYDRVMNTNVRGPLLLTTLAIPYIKASRGNIVNVSSVCGTRSFPNVLSYCMSKAAIDQLTRCAALELGPMGIRINAVNPGVIKTGLQLKSSLNTDEYAEFMKKCVDTHALQRAGEPEEVASVIVFLASNAASNITGATIPVDGGRHAMCPR